MKKICLIYPPSNKRYIPVFPAGIAMLGGILKEIKGIEVSLLDAECDAWIYNFKKTKDEKINFERINSMEVIKSLRNTNPQLPNEICKEGEKLFKLLEDKKEADIYCFSIMGYYQFFSALIMSFFIKKYNKKATIVFGGIFFNKDSAGILEDFKFIDYIFIGIAENNFRKFIKGKITNSLSLYQINNLVYVEGNVLKINNKKIEEEYYPDNFCYNQDYFKKYKLQAEILYKDKDIVKPMLHIYVGDKFCPYKCNYCRVRSMKGKLIDPKSIADRMHNYYMKFGVNLFNVLANELNPSKDFLDKFLNQLIRYKSNLKWLAYLRPSLFYENQFKKIYEAGGRVIRFGVESGSNRILKFMEKGIDVSEMEKALKLSHKNNIWNHVNFMVGYIHETEEDIFKTLEFIKRDADYIDSIRINPFFLPKNTKISSNPNKYGIEIISEEEGYLVYNEINGLNYEQRREFMKKYTKLILDTAIDLGIGFQGVIPFMLLMVYSRFEDKEQTKNWYRENHSYTYMPLSSEALKTCLANSNDLKVSQEKEINKSWENLFGKRGDNYNIRLKCID